MKVTEPGLNTLIDNLNTLICEDSLLTRQGVKPGAGRGGHRRHESTRQHEKGEAPTVARREKGRKRPPA